MASISCFSTVAIRDAMIGQPTPETHPHLMEAGQITPGISAKEYRDRREALVEKIPDGSVALVAGFGLRYATSGIFYPFHQNTDLLYLSGFNEPDAAMVLEKNSSLKTGHKYTLYVRPRDRRNEVWDGPRSGISGAKSFFEADEAKPIHQLPDAISHILNTPLKTKEARIFTDLPLTQTTKPIQSSASHAAHPPDTPAWTNHAQVEVSSNPLLRAVKVPGFTDNRNKIKKLSDVVDSLRLLKSEAEIKVMRKAGQITGRAFVEAMAASKPNIPEAVLASTVEHGVRLRGADGLAYVPVVAGGANALTLHYVINKGLVNDGEMVLMDAGAEYAGYAADVTRTWPVSGKFTPAQRDVYESVLKVQKECIKRCTEEADVTLDNIQNLAFELLRVECSRMFGRRIGMGEMNSLYPHHVGHWLGLDVHDTASVTRSTKLREGMVVTIEPGLYIPSSGPYPPEYRNIGIRIEDNIAVGKTSPIVLTTEAPKEVADIEAVCAGLVGARDLN
ncbi:hypothetical protein HDV05_000052 [Chytridiales sp. JEL 0842]|nr:hypothetical protein HDV05_000052 [Chytridiales sp. JEL 0842]